MRPGHSMKLERQVRQNAGASHSLGPPRRSGIRAVRARALLVVEIEIRHPGARSDSINSEMASISERSSSSDSSAATSAASSSCRRVARAARTSDVLIASERLIPVASRVLRACSASSSRRTEIASVIGPSVSRFVIQPAIIERVPLHGSRSRAPYYRVRLSGSGGNWVDGRALGWFRFIPADRFHHLAKVRVAGSYPVVRSKIGSSHGSSDLHMRRLCESGSANQALRT